jgi:nitroreductase
MDGFDEKSIKENFNIEEYKIIPLLIAIGYKSPNFTLAERAFRRPLDEFVKYI